MIIQIVIWTLVGFAMGMQVDKLEDKSETKEAAEQHSARETDETLRQYPNVK